MRGSRAADRDIVLALQRPCSETEFGALAADLTGPNAASVARFLLDVIRPQDGSDARRPNALLTAFLARSATADGCIELILSVPDRSVLLQGWGTVGDDEVELLLPGAGLPRYTAPVARFARADVQSPASGVVLALPPEALGALAGLETVFILAGDRLIARQIIDQRVLDPDSSIGQLRHLLPRLTCQRATMELFRMAAEPQYQGHDTLAGSGRPVRAALDVAIAVAGVGAYLSGWLFDPAADVAEFSLCWTGGTVRVDQACVRIAREDVCRIFRDDSKFPPAQHHEPGFAFACDVVPSPLSSAHLRLKFNDGELAFMPVRFSASCSHSVRRALLQTVDLHKPSALAIVERHLAPFLSRIQFVDHQPGAAVLLGPVERSHAIVVPLRGTVPPRAFLSSFLRDQPRPHEQIVFVCGPEWAYGHHQSLIDLVSFYELPASIVALTHEVQPAGALAAAASITRAETFLYLSPDAAGAEPGWREALYAGAHGNDVACPTILYEDQSVRFAGGSNVHFTDRAPYARVHAQGAGLPRQAVARGGMPASMEGGSLACCLIRRPVVPLLERSAPLATAFGQETGLFLSLREAGVSSSWVASVCVTVPEDDVDAAPLPRIIDGWILKDLWGGMNECAF